ncbi:CLUMA_CG002790, isoform A [Clunio marinus]|uniref:CLUMA_CG002790, isoform A n=1 Tax=Clunio marinus TaxID=568069 RepID=A0A1J1HS92_9DIPT|nr:CLUMA_CG002790, isoform A [Clunio marinus]
MYLSQLQHSQLQLATQLHQKLATDMTTNLMESGVFKSPSSSPNSQNALSNINNINRSPASSPTRELSSHPLNRLQNMEPFDFRKINMVEQMNINPFASGMPTKKINSEALQQLQQQQQHEQQQQQHQMRENIKKRDSSASDSLNTSSAGNLPKNFLNLSMGHLPFHLPPTSLASSFYQSLAASLVAQSFPNLLASTKAPMSLTSSKSEYQSQKNTERLDLSSHHHPYDILSKNSDLDVLNLSRKNKIPKHLSEINQDMAHHGGPPNLGTHFINPSTGKKRVQCNVCFKTFWGKSYLKVHFSSVHLREMHKCTVEGCSRMFNSRRSRNRHSANPKLHPPHFRRNISPHDGRSAQPNPMLLPPPTALPLRGGLLPFNQFQLLPQGDLRHQSMASLVPWFPNSLASTKAPMSLTSSKSEYQSQKNTERLDLSSHHHPYDILSKNSDLDVLNLSRKNKIPKHLSEINQDMAHHGGPPNLGTHFINPSTGKKRVQCNVCFKTFWGKSYLKVHFSSVHLREMHKCTVEGCSRMFNSRRSRNRHSANPKLHPPHFRRNISPHDGRSAQPNPMLLPPPTALPLRGGLLPFNQFQLLPQGDLRHQSMA